MAQRLCVQRVLALLLGAEDMTRAKWSWQERKYIADLNGEWYRRHISRDFGSLWLQPNLC